MAKSLCVAIDSVKGSMSPRVLRAAIGAVVVLAVFRPCMGQQAPPAAKTASPLPPVASADVLRAIADLSSPNFVVREKAAQQLWQAGAKAQPALEKVVAESDDFDAVFRARQLLSSFRLGIYPDTPPETVALITRFHLGNYSMKQQIAQELMNSGKRDLLKRLIDQEPNNGVREQLRRLTSARSGVARIVDADDPFGGPRMLPAPKAPDIGAEARRKIAERDVDGAERLLREANSGAAVRDYAALLLSQNKLGAEIAQLRGKTKPGDIAGQRRLAMLLRANGDLPAALTAAKAAKDDALAENLLVESGDWKELAKASARADVPALASSPVGVNRLARIIVLRYLAGDKSGCDAAVAAAIKVVKTASPEQLEPQLLIAPLILSDRVDSCIELLTPRSPRSAFNLLVGQDRLGKAFQLAKADPHAKGKTDWAAWIKDGKDGDAIERTWFAQSVAKALHSVGEDDRAWEVLTATADVAGKPKSSFRLNLMKTAVELGDTKKIDALAARLFAKDDEIVGDVLKELYGDQGELAKLFWQDRRNQFPNEGALATLQALRRLLVAKPDATVLDELRSFAVQAEKVNLVRPFIQGANTPSDENRFDERARGFLALAALFHRCHNSKLTERYLRRISTLRVSERTLIEVGNLAAEEKLWDRAVRAYSSALSKERRNAAALYLLGWAQAKQGDVPQGAKNKALALLLPLGDGEGRLELIRTLVRLQEQDEAARQRQILLRTADFDDRAVVQTLWEIGEAASPPKDGPTPAAAMERTMVLFTRGGIFLPEVRYYLNVAYSLHRAKALSLLSAGKTAEAVEELHRAEAVMPVNVQLSLDCDALLRKHGAAAAADALYRRMADRLQNDCREFPRSAGCRNDLAWLAANLDRDLDMALFNAQKAVELEPQSAGILDTLAEVQYRRGNRAEAARLCKRCMELDGDNRLFKERLARFEK